MDGIIYLVGLIVIVMAILVLRRPALAEPGLAP